MGTKWSLNSANASSETKQKMSIFHPLGGGGGGGSHRETQLQVVEKFIDLNKRFKGYSNKYMFKYLFFINKYISQHLELESEILD